MSTWWLFFGWPAGGVWSNLIASLIWDVPIVAAGWVKLHRSHKAAAAAHRISAGLYKQLTGHDHPDAPGGTR